MRQLAIVVGLVLTFTTSCTRTYTLVSSATDMMDSDSAFIYNVDYDIVARLAVEKGCITFSESVDGSDIRLYSDRLSTFPFIAEEGTIVVDHERNCAVGTPLNERLAEYIQRSDSLRSGAERSYYDVLHSDLDEDLKTERLDSIISLTFDALIELADKTVAANDDNALGRLVFLVDIARNDALTPEKYGHHLSKVSSYIADYPPVATVTRRFEAAQKTAVGQPYVDFAIENECNTQRFSSFVTSGKPTLLVFWTMRAWDSFMMLEAVRELASWHADALSTVCVDVMDEARDWTTFVREEADESCTHLFDGTRQSSDTYGVTRFPYVILLNAAGTIVARGIQPSALEHWISTELKSDEQ